MLKTIDEASIGFEFLHKFNTKCCLQVETVRLYLLACMDTRTKYRCTVSTSKPQQSFGNSSSAMPETAALTGPTRKPPRGVDGISIFMMVDTRCESQDDTTWGDI